MKKILFSLVALVCSMSMNAQVMKVMKGDKVVATFLASKADKVVFEDAPLTGTATRKGGIEVKWVQLWENGPRFAEYNVGAANNKAEDYGGYYCWGKCIDKDISTEYKEGNSALTGNDDTATNLWGNDWRMPTQNEYDDLIANCEKEWTSVNGVNGLKFTGRGDYSSNSIFLSAGGCFFSGVVDSEGIYGYYWSSTPYGDARAYDLFYGSFGNGVSYGVRHTGYSVRAVLAE